MSISSCWKTTPTGLQTPFPQDGIPITTTAAATCGGGDGGGCGGACVNPTLINAAH